MRHTHNNKKKSREERGRTADKRQARGIASSLHDGFTPSCPVRNCICSRIAEEAKDGNKFDYAGVKDR